MTVLDYILDGVEAELALERELGVHSVPCDRTLLSTPSPTPQPTPSPQPSPSPTPQPPPQPSPSTATSYAFVFLHDRALSTGGIAMMAKIIPAMGKTVETAPIVFTGEKPAAKVYVVLGGNALKKWYPGVQGTPGNWVTSERNVLVTYSPEYILRFGSVTPTVQKLKREMWTNLKQVLTKVNGQ